MTTTALGPSIAACCRWSELWQTIRQEPYRIGFALGVLNLLLGLGLWLPAVLLGGGLRGQIQLWHMPLLLHATLGGFVFGFLGTFLQRFLQSPPCSSATMILALVALLGLPVALFTGQEVLAQCATLLLWGVIAGLVLARMRALRQRAAPPLILLVLGVAAGVVAAAWPLSALLGRPPVPVLAVWLREVQDQGVLLLIIMGLAPVLVRRLRGGGACHAPDPATGRRKAVVVSVLGSLFLLSWLPAASGSSLGAQLGAGLRALIAAAILSQGMPLYRPPRGVPVFLHGVWLAFVCIVAGLALPALWPGHPMAWKHILFLGGFLLLTLMIASRVLSAHGGRPELVDQDRWVLGTVIALVVAGMLSRVSVDWTPDSRERHLFYAAACVLGGVLLWGTRYLPMLWQRNGGERS